MMSKCSLLTVKRSCSQGLGWIDLLVFIVLVAGFMAINEGEMNKSLPETEAYLIQNLTLHLTNAATAYQSQQNTPPKDFSDFVDTEHPRAKAPKTLALQRFGKGTCQVKGPHIMGCTFQNYDDVIYVYNQGQITVTGVSKNGAPALN